MPVLALALALLLSACGGEGDSGSVQRVEVTDTACQPGELKTVKTGVLTIGTTETLEEPYFEDGDPVNGRGFLGALGYELAAGLGYGKSAVEWVTADLGAGSGNRPDFDIALLSEVPAVRAIRRRFDLSEPFYLIPQAIVAKEGSDLAEAESFDQLKGARLGVIRASAGQRAANKLIDPVRPPREFREAEDMLQAISSGSLDVGLLGLPEALEGVDGIPGLAVSRQFAFPDGGRWSVLSPVGSDSIPCVDEAIGRLREDGVLQELDRQWMVDSVEVPRVG